MTQGDTGRGRPSTSYTGEPVPDGLAEILVDLARSLQDESDLQDTLGAIVTAAVGTVPGAEHAGLTVAQSGRRLRTCAATADVVQEVDAIQYATSQGPCLEASHEHRTIRLPDMNRERRWPDFCMRTARLGILSMLSFQLYVERDNMGALSLYSTRANAFSDESEHVGLLFAAHAAVAMAGARREQELVRALSARDLIGQAKGILMERHKLTGDQSFQLLVRASQRANTKLTDIAHQLVETGELAERAVR
ncbi:transcriptional regulator [Actinoplanes sp. NBRC 14428]|nr:transcriptional regulator [Actinoplanes sp. NBRC 14428]